MSVENEPRRPRLGTLAVSACISSVTTLSIFLLSMSPIYHVYELKSLDFFQRFNPPRGGPEVTLVEINQESLNALSEQGIHWPWPRQIYVPIVRVCDRLDAKAVLFDIIFSEPSSFGRDDDLRLASAIAETGNVYMPISLSRTSRHLDDVGAIQNFGIPDPGSGLRFSNANSYIPPMEEYLGVVRGVGNVMVEPDRDGIYRRNHLFVRFKEYLFPSLAAAPLLARLSLMDEQVRLMDRRLHTTEEGDLLIYYYGSDFRFPRINALEILSAYQNPGSDLAVSLRRKIQGHYVIIGLTAPGLYDLKPTPVTSVSPGAYIHATALTNLLKNHHIKQIPPMWKISLLFLAGMLLAYPIIRVFSVWRILIIVALFLLGLPAIGFLAFHVYKYWIGFFSYEVSALMVIGVASTYRYHTEGKKRRVIRRLFTHYMSEALVRDLEANPHRAKLGGEKKSITIFFSDLVNFTGLSERLQPEETVSLLNDYFTEMGEIIMDLKGIIDKYQGDGVMAFWGAPIQLSEHAELACLAALRCQQRMERVNRRQQAGQKTPVAMRIGLNSGEAVVGNMGSSQRFDYTFVGDNVNLASRLESVNSLYGTQVIISEETYSLAKNLVEARELDLIAVKGREKPIRIFELLGEHGRVSSDMIRLKEQFEEGLRLYRSRQYVEAGRNFERILSSNPEDRASRLFVRRCRDFSRLPPPSNWDGVFRMPRK